MECLIALVPTELWPLIDSYSLPRSVRSSDRLEDLNQPAQRGVCVDHKGKVYFVDPAGTHYYDGTKQKIYVLNHGAVFPLNYHFPLYDKTFLTNSECMSFDGKGNLYAVDSYHHVVWKITRDGKVITLAGSGTAGYSDGHGADAAFKYPSALCIDYEQNVLVCDNGNSVIRKITPDGGVTTLAGTPGQRITRDGPASQSAFEYPVGICFNGGNIYVTDKNLIRKISPSGRVSTLAQICGGQICVDHQGNMVVANRKKCELNMVTQQGACSVLMKTKGLPISVCVDFDGNVLYTNAESHLHKVCVGSSPKPSQYFVQLTQLGI